LGEKWIKSDSRSSGENIDDEKHASEKQAGLIRT
jgi:hypothetical protein